MEVSRYTAPRSVEQSPSASNVQQAEKRAQLKAANEEALARREQQQENPKPVVNTQGQTTGRLLNVTA